MAVSPKLTSFRIRDPLVVRIRLESLSVAVKKYSLSVQVQYPILCVEVCVCRLGACTDLIPGSH